MTELLVLLVGAVVVLASFAVLAIVGTFLALTIVAFGTRVLLNARLRRVRFNRGEPLLLEDA